jgi:hypothetical protein
MAALRVSHIARVHETREAYETRSHKISYVYSWRRNGVGMVSCLIMGRNETVLHFCNYWDGDWLDKTTLDDSTTPMYTQCTWHVHRMHIAQLSISCQYFAD